MSSAETPPHFFSSCHHAPLPCSCSDPRRDLRQPTRPRGACRPPRPSQTHALGEAPSAPQPRWGPGLGQRALGKGTVPTSPAVPTPALAQPHTRSLTCISSSVPAQKLSHTYTRAVTYTHAHEVTHAFTLTLVHAHTHLHTDPRSHTHAFTLTRTCTRVHTHTPDRAAPSIGHPVPPCQQCACSVLRRWQGGVPLKKRASGLGEEGVSGKERPRLRGRRDPPCSGSWFCAWAPGPPHTGWPQRTLPSRPKERLPRCLHPHALSPRPPGPPHPAISFPLDLTASCLHAGGWTGELEPSAESGVLSRPPASHPPIHRTHLPLKTHCAAPDPHQTPLPHPRQVGLGQGSGLRA